MRTISVLLILFFTSMSSHADLYLEYSEQMAKIFKVDKVISKTIERLVADTKLFIYAGDSLNSQVVEFKISEINKLAECYLGNRINDFCDSNDSLERTPDAEPPEWFEFVPQLIQNLDAESNVGILFTGIDGQLTYLLNMLKSQSVPFSLSMQGGNSRLPLIYLSIGNKGGITNQKDLIGVYPFEKHVTRLPACSFTCKPGANYPLIKNCIQNQIAGIVTAYAWRYPASPLSTKFLECSSNTLPPFPLIERGTSTLQLPYRKDEFFRALESCWKENNITIDHSELNYADIKIEALIEVSSANSNAVRKLPRRVLTELEMALGVDGQEYPITVKREMLLVFSECD